MPVRGEDRLHLLRSLIDGLVPRQARLLAERGHGLDQLIDLRIQQRLPVAGLEGLGLVGCTRVPALNRDGVR